MEDEKVSEPKLVEKWKHLPEVEECITRFGEPMTEMNITIALRNQKNSITPITEEQAIREKLRKMLEMMHR